MNNSILDGFDAELLYDEPLSSYTGFATGGNARCIVIPRSESAFIGVITALRDGGERWRVLGNGTNILAPDEGWDGYVVLTRDALSVKERTGDNSVYCGTGEPLASLCAYAAARSLSGLEFASGIPGTVGGAVYMNAGAYDGEIKDVISYVRALDGSGNVVTLPKEELELSYRSSIFHRNKDLIILGGFFKFISKPENEIREKMNELLVRRREKQPVEYPSCGSTFKRPEGSFASKLIEECGLKGERVGGAEVSRKHAGFVINAGGATSADILELIAKVQKTVKEKTGFELECEIEILK